MEEKKKAVTILLAEDDEDDYLLTSNAFKECQLLNTLNWVKDGEELMDYLLRKGKYDNPSTSPRPVIILLDLNMPKKDGRECLKEIKANPILRQIPVLVLTTSQADEDILKTYDLGASSFIRKPVDFEKFTNVITSLKKYWLEIVELPR